MSDKPKDGELFWIWYDRYGEEFKWHLVQWSDHYDGFYFMDVSDSELYDASNRPILKVENVPTEIPTEIPIVHCQFCDGSFNDDRDQVRRYRGNYVCRACFKEKELGWERFHCEEDEE